MMGFVKDNFYQGEYAEVLRQTYEDRQKVDPSFYSYIVGSLIFLGRTEEAHAFYRSLHKDLGPVEKAYTYFFLAIGLTRRSQYPEAKKYLILNKRLSKQLDHKNAEVRFLVEQGISFFLYFLGQFEKSLGWSQKSLSSAMTTQDYWMKALSYDLLANNLIQTGKIHEGLQQFEEAIKFARKLKNIALTQAFEIAHLIFRCEYGIQIQKSFEELERKFFSLADKDAFSKANLGLEYVRQLTLRGEWNSAIDKLEEISHVIYQSQNRRQEARLNLRWAEICFLKNEPTSALHYIRSGKRCLEFVDQTYEIQFLGLEIKVYEKLKRQAAPIELKERLRELSSIYRSIKNNNILSRAEDPTLSSSVPNFTSDDEIHQRLLEASQNENAARKVIFNTHFFSWVYRFFNLEYGENYILLNLGPKSITCLSKNGVSHKPDELSTLAFKILTTLSRGFTSKEALVTAVWGYQYDPLRHDSLIYSSFSSLRKGLGVDANFIETSEMGYKLNATLLNLLDQTNESEKIVNAFQPVLIAKGQSDKIVALAKVGLNSRQIQILTYLKSNEFISVKNVVSLFSTSEITANRDLRALYEKKLVIRVGQGRATQYSLNNE